MPDIDDNQLIKRVAQGDERAFLTLYDCYVGGVHALTLRILGNPMLVEEATALFLLEDQPVNAVQK